MGAVTAPGRLALVERFVNTLQVDSERDELATPEGLGAWLFEHALAPTPAGWTSEDVRRAVDLREALRALLLANNGADVDLAAVATANPLAREAPLAAITDAAGRTRLESLGTGIAVPLGRLLAAVVEAQADGSWSRLKACQADDCRWAFYDASRNRSRTWCSMQVCGNRSKARAYRARH
jgi:predicted RNA-binding Zn ribbon-like protein